MDATTQFWTGRRVLVTGATGTLGSAVLRSLLHSGCDVTAFLRSTSDPSEFFSERLFDQVQVVRGRIDDGPTLTTALAVGEIEALIHCAKPRTGETTSAARLAYDVLTAARAAVPYAAVVMPVNLPKVLAVAEAFRETRRNPIGLVRLPQPLRDREAAADLMQLAAERTIRRERTALRGVYDHLPQRAAA